MQQQNRQESPSNTQWRPCDDLLSENTANYAIIVLNTAIDSRFNKEVLLKLWAKASVRITADGGTDRWLTWLKSIHDLDIDQIAPPDIINGDMDSLSPATLNHFSNSERTKIMKTPDQDETDFTKALLIMQKHAEENNFKIEFVWVVVNTEGRFDQILANIHTLYKAREFLPETRIFQLATSSITWLLDAGNHTISIPQVLRDKQEWCALVPLSETCHVTSTGLKWNLSNTKMEFGRLISTSNTYANDTQIVQLYTDKRIVWSMGIEPLTIQSEAAL